MGKERCHSLITREAVAGFRTLPDKTLGSAPKFGTETRSQRGTAGEKSSTFSESIEFQESKLPRAALQKGSLLQRQKRPIALGWTPPDGIDVP